MMLSSSPSLQEKIEFLLQNYDKADTLDCRSTTTIEEKTPADDGNMFQMTCTGSSRLSQSHSNFGGSRAVFSVKEEYENQPGVTKLRKKVCRKSFRNLTDEYKVPNQEAKELALNLDQKLIDIYPKYEQLKHYAAAYKKIFKRLKVVPFLQSSARYP